MDQSKENKVIIDGQTCYGGLNQPNLKFIKVNVDCWEKIFDFLSLRDILAMSQTCQRMRQIGGYYFRENFHGVPCALEENCRPNFYTSNEPIQLERDDFLRFIDTASIYGELAHLNDYLNMNLLTSLTTIRLCYVDLAEQEVEIFENQYDNQIERIELFVCTIHGNALQQLFDYCPNMKCLRMERNNFEPLAAAHSFFHQNYPSLREFQYTRGLQIDLAAMFLERNPSITCFNTDANDLWSGGHTLLASNVQLNRLSIELYSDEIKTVAIEFADLLKVLHKRGFYKQLHLVATWPLTISDYREFINGMTQFDAVEMLCTYQFHGLSSHMVYLKELHIRETEDGIALETLAVNLKQLERLWIKGADDQIILPFLRHSKRLKIAIVLLTDCERINLLAMNRERDKLKCERPSNVLIGVQETIYLNTKRISQNCHFNLVEITREESVHGKFEYISTYVEY